MPEIYPNPANSKLYIQNLKKEGFAEILNMEGISVFHEPFESSRYYIDIESLPQGSYILKLEGSNLNYSYQFIKE